MPASTNDRLLVVVVDDNPESLELTSSELRGCGFRVLPQLGPFGVSALVNRERPSVIVLDVMMPGLSGDGLGKVIRNSSDAPIVYFSAMPEEELRDLSTRTPRSSYVLRSEGVGYLAQEIVRQTRRSSFIPPSFPGR
jgi:CheY-like chemotaxis protein